MTYYPKCLLLLIGCFILLSVAAFLSCSRESGPPGHILVRNDILDKAYNSFVVDRVMSKSGASGFRKTLKPGEKIVLPQKGVTRLRFTRRYEDLSRVYVVKCPGSTTDRITMKLIDVHTNRIQGGCKLVKKGKKVGGVISWVKN